MYLKINGKRATQNDLDKLMGKPSKEPVKCQDNGLCFVTFIVFLVLKLCGVINWSWWFVTAPLWGPFVIVLSIFLAFILLWKVWKVLKAIVEWDCNW